MRGSGSKKCCGNLFDPFLARYGEFWAIRLSLRFPQAQSSQPFVRRRSLGLLASLDSSACLHRPQGAAGFIPRRRNGKVSIAAQCLPP